MGVNENDEDGILDSGSQPSAEANRYKQPKKILEFRIDLKSAVMCQADFITCLANIITISLLPLPNIITVLGQF